MVVVGIVVGNFVGILLHELGHGTAAGALGCGPRMVSVGAGPIFCRFQMGRVWFVFRRVPLFGYVEHLPQGRDRRLRLALVIAAGPAVNVFLVASAFGAGGAGFDTDSTALAGLLFGLVLAQAILAFGSLYPRYFSVGRDRRIFCTDGWWLLEIIRGRHVGAFDPLHAMYMRLPGAPAGATPHSADAAEVLYQLSRHDLAIEGWPRRDSVTVLRRLLADSRLNEAEEKVVRCRLQIADANPDLF